MQVRGNDRHEFVHLLIHIFVKLYAFKINHGSPTCFQTLTPSKQGLMSAQGGRPFKFEKPTIVGKLFVIGWVTFQDKMAKLWHHDVAGSPFQHQK